jgi:hypothetical protein
MDVSLTPSPLERSALGWHAGEQEIMEILGIATFHYRT